jgi:polyphosphate kinase
VKIDLIVRGMCILRAGVPGLSENIRVRSLVGRLLEHSRIYYFGNLGDPVVGLASADWMSRNLDRRVECLVRITDETLRQRLVGILECCLTDTAQAREMNPDGTYQRVRPVPGQPARSSFDVLMAEGAALERPVEDEEGLAPQFTPRRKGE